MIIGKEAFVSSNISSITNVFMIAITNIRQQQYLLEVFEVISQFIQVYPNIVLLPFQQCLKLVWNTLLSRDMDTGFIGGILLLCRVLLENSNYFFQFFKELEKKGGTHFQKFLDMIIKVSKLSLKYVNDERLLVIAISTLFESPDCCYNQIPFLVETCISLLESCNSKERKHNRRYIKKINMIPNSPCYRTKKQLENNDKSLNRNEVEFLLEKLKEGQNQRDIWNVIVNDIKPKFVPFFQDPKKYLSLS